MSHQLLRKQACPLSREPNQPPNGGSDTANKSTNMDLITRLEFEEYKEATLNSIKEIQNKLHENSTMTQGLSEDIKPLATGLDDLLEGIEKIYEKTSKVSLGRSPCSTADHPPDVFSPQPQAWRVYLSIIIVLLFLATIYYFLTKSG